MLVYLSLYLVGFEVVDLAYLHSGGNILAKYNIQKTEFSFYRGGNGEVVFPLPYHIHVQTHIGKALVHLLDFYGDLLTEKQRESLDYYYNDDLSLGEIAQEHGISRQGVWDNIRHAEASMRGIEEKTGLIRRFEATRSGLQEVRRLAEGLPPSDEALQIRRRVDALLSAL